MRAHTHNRKHTQSCLFTLGSMYNSQKLSLSCAHYILNLTAVKLYSVMLPCFCSFWPFLNHISPLESLFIVKAIQRTNTNLYKGAGTLLPFWNAEICSRLPICMCNGVVRAVYIVPQWHSAVGLAI